MTILEDLLKNMEKSPSYEKIRKISDSIMEEERLKFKNPELEIKGANVLLSIQVDNKTDRVQFLCLEREFKEEYIVSLYEVKPNSSIIKKRVYQINSYVPEKVFKFYAETLKYFCGE